MITSWERRAAYVNTRPVPGLLSTFPHGDLPRGLDIETILMTALHVDWRLLCTSICSSIKRVPRTDFDKVVVFGNERVLLQLQTYRRQLPISYMLQYYLFGNNFNKVEQYKIKRTPRTFLFHIASMEIAKQIFNVGDLCSAEVSVNSNNNNNNNMI